MKKTLIAAGIAAVVAAPAAFADVKVSGGVEAAFTKKDGTAAANSANDQWSYSSDNYVTFAASEDLGNGLTAFASMTLDIDGGVTFSDNDGSNVKTKDEVIGLKGSFGTVVMGRMEDFTEGKLMSRVTLEGDGSAGGGAGIEAASAGNAGRTNGALAYVSPTFNGFHVGVAGFAMTETANVSSSFDATDIAVFYDNGPLSIAASRETMKQVAGTSDTKTTVLTASYKMGDAKATVLRYDSDVNGTASDHTDMIYRLDYKMGANAITLAMNDNEKAGGTDGDNVWSVELAHNFSKTTKAYVNMVDGGDYNKSAIRDTMTVGLKHKF